jgi:hypothetical protein
MTPLTLPELRRQFEHGSGMSASLFLRIKHSASYEYREVQLRWAGYLACARANGVLKK